MKKIAIVTALLTLLLSACAPTVDTTPSPQATASASVVPDASASAPANTATQTPTAPPTTPPTTADIASDAALAALYNNGYSTHFLIGIDQFGRTFDVTTGDRDGKEVGIFYWPWFDDKREKIYDNTKILAMENGLGLLTSMDPEIYDPEISPAGEVHWWGEPLWGYYNSLDEWVIRKQLKLLTYAGIDYLCFDCTNMLPFIDEARLVLRVMNELIQEGWDCPRLTFMTHARSMATVRQLYRKIYKANYCPDAWYKKNGKPFIIGYTDPAPDQKEADGRNDTSYKPELSEEILNFFTFGQPQWPSEQPLTNGIPWVEWTYPAPLHKGYDIMNVSVSAHPGCPYSFSLTRPGHINWGRGWSVTEKKNITEDVEKGTYFQSTWDVALKADPSMIFVGGWNEWTMAKGVWDGEYYFCDNVNMEYSRDIEIMKGGYNDAFYIQMLQNIRKFKHTSGSIHGTLPNATPNDSFDWSSVPAVFRNTGIQNYSRDHSGAAKSVYYTEAAARNNIQEVRVTKDSENLYFYILCENDITPYDGKNNWINLFIGTGELTEKGWNGYEYVVNRHVNGSVSEVTALSADFSGSKAGDASLRMSGAAMVVTVPRSAIGLSDNDNNFYFKVSDHITSPSDIMDYYVSGRSLPMGRLSFRYVG